MCITNKPKPYCCIVFHFRGKYHLIKLANIPGLDHYSALYNNIHSVKGKSSAYLYQIPPLSVGSVDARLSAASAKLQSKHDPQGLAGHRALLTLEQSFSFLNEQLYGPILKETCDYIYIYIYIYDTVCAQRHAVVENGVVSRSLDGVTHRARCAVWRSAAGVRCRCLRSRSAWRSFRGVCCGVGAAPRPHPPLPRRASSGPESLWQRYLETTLGPSQSP